MITWGQSRLPACSGTNAALWNMCFGSVDMQNGDKYSGEFMNGKFEGRGTYANADGTKCIGQLKNNKAEGQGTYK